MLKMLKSRKSLAIIISLIVLVVAFSLYYFLKMRNKQIPTNFNAVTVEQKIQVLKDLNQGGDTSPKTEAEVQQITKEKTEALKNLSNGFNQKKSMSVEQKTNLLNSLQ